MGTTEMSRALVLFVLVALWHTPSAHSQCALGYTDKSSAATTTRGSNAASCTTGNCCTLNLASCRAAGTVCGSGKYEDPTKYGATSGTTSAQKIANCCSNVATCSDYTCPAGYTKIASPSSMACSNAVSSCTTSTCCTPTAGTCANATMTCPSGKYKDSA